MFQLADKRLLRSGLQRILGEESLDGEPRRGCGRDSPPLRPFTTDLSVNGVNRLDLAISDVSL
jgi:hypothetical protein